MLRVRRGGIFLEKLFHLKEHGTNIRTEIIAGLTTFFTMAYIIFLNPLILGENSPTGMANTAVVTATCIAAAIGTWLIGWLSNYPMAQAPGLGLNAVFAYTLCGAYGLSAGAALSAVFIAGIIFILLTVTGARTALVKAIPLSLKKAIGAGIGMFIALIGFVNAGIVIGENAGSATTVGMGNFASPTVLLACVGVILTIVLVVAKVPAALFISMIATSVIGCICQFVFGIEMGVSAPTSWVPYLDFSMFGKCFTSFGDLFSAPLASLLATMITLVLVDMFDTIGTLIGAADKAGYLDENGDLPKIEKAMLADAIATSTGAIVGTSTVTTYVESTSGISAGGRTGLTSTVTGLCFALSLFLSPIVGLVPSAATAPILIVVGVMMCGSLKDIDWSDIEVAIPCFLTVAGMPFFYSITDGLAFGFIAYFVVKLAKGKFKEIHPLMYVIVILFVIKYILSALTSMGVI
ncbi:MAG: NCS2 family permease [Clostridia bacterium]|nr:NCS2 family permease [Clostridia bacterium]